MDQLPAPFSGPPPDAALVHGASARVDGPDVVGPVDGVQLPTRVEGQDVDAVGLAALILRGLSTDD